MSGLLSRLFVNFVNVKRFKAVGDGVANDLPAILAGLDYLNSVGGGILFFPAGTYLVNGGLSTGGIRAQILVKYSNITLQGESGAVLTTTDSDSSVVAFLGGGSFYPNNPLGPSGWATNQVHYPIDGPTDQAARSIVMANSLDASRFLEGDFILIRNGSTFPDRPPNGFSALPYPDCEINQVASVDDTEIRLKHPTSKTYVETGFIVWQIGGVGVDSATSTSATLVTPVSLLPGAPSLPNLQLAVLTGAGAGQILPVTGFSVDLLTVNLGRSFTIIPSPADTVVILGYETYDTGYLNFPGSPGSALTVPGVANVTNLVIENVGIRDLAIRAPRSSHSAIFASQVSGLTIDENIISEMGENGILARVCRDIRIQGNTIHKHDSQPGITDAINVAGCVDVQVDGNIITGLKPTRLLIEGGTANCTVSNNIVRVNTSSIPDDPTQNFTVVIRRRAYGISILDNLFANTWPNEIRANGPSVIWVDSRCNVGGMIVNNTLQSSEPLSFVIDVDGAGWRVIDNIIPPETSIQIGPAGTVRYIDFVPEYFLNDLVDVETGGMGDTYQELLTYDYSDSRWVNRRFAIKPVTIGPFYVDPVSGSDLDDGDSIGSAWATLAHAAQVLNKLDTGNQQVYLYVLPGTLQITEPAYFEDNGGNLVITSYSDSPLDTELEFRVDGMAGIVVIGGNNRTSETNPQTPILFRPPALTISKLGIRLGAVSGDPYYQGCLMADRAGTLKADLCRYYGDPFGDGARHLTSFIIANGGGEAIITGTNGMEGDIGVAFLAQGSGSKLRWTGEIQTTGDGVNLLSSFLMARANGVTYSANAWSGLGDFFGRKYIARDGGIIAVAAGLYAEEDPGTYNPTAAADALATPGDQPGVVLSGGSVVPTLFPNEF